MKTKIKVGDIVTFKCGDKGIITKRIRNCGNDILYAEMICEEKLKELNIIKIDRPVEYETVYERAEEEKKEILNETEKKYLQNIIKPFRDRVNAIEEMADFNQYEKEYIRITIKRDSSIVLPYFESKTMYKGMKQGKDYTLKELGLEDED